MKDRIQTDEPQTLYMNGKPIGEGTVKIEFLDSNYTYLRGVRGLPVVQGDFKISMDAENETALRKIARLAEFENLKRLLAYDTGPVRPFANYMKQSRAKSLFVGRSHGKNYFLP